MKTSLLMIISLKDKNYKELFDFVSECECEVVVEDNIGTGIQHAQNQFFDIIILDTKVKGMEISQTIKIFKNLNPQVKIIVKTDSSSKNLEAQIRKERIYYYHIDSFEISDLKLALKSALQNCQHDQRIKIGE